MKYALCFFPAVGVFCTGALWLWYALCCTLGVSGVLFAAVAAALPLLITGGIHMDGFMDTVDALSSHQSKERKLEIMNAKLEKDLRGSVNRRVNCDAANLDKVVEAAMRQVDAIRHLEMAGQLEILPEKLRETARLRLAHPEDTLAQLAHRCDPPITKSALNHRLRKLKLLANSVREREESLYDYEGDDH